MHRFNPCQPCCATCNLSVKVIGCNNPAFPLGGVTVTVKDSLGTTTIGTGVTGSDGVARVSVPASGTYRVSTDACTPASTNVTVSCPAGGSVTLSSCINVSVALRGCTGGPLAVSPLPTVHITDPSTGWTSSNQVPRPGPYQVTVDESCDYEAAGPVAITVPSCSLYTTPPIQLTSKTFTRKIQVNGCHGLPLPGASVTLEGNSYSQTQVTGGGGIATFTGVRSSGDSNGGCNYTVTISKSRFETLVDAGVVFCDQELIGVEQLTPSAGYICCGCADPWPTTLFVTDANGTHTATYDSGSGEWRCCYSGPVDTLYCGTVSGFICQDDINGQDITVQGTAGIGYRISCSAGDGSTPPSMQLRQTVSACQTHSADSHGGVMAGWCDGVFPGSLKCDGTQVPWTSSPTLTNVDVRECQSVAPLMLSFTLAGACYPCGTVGVSE